MSSKGPSKKKIGPGETRLKHEQGFSGAVFERGNSFIAAAELMLEHSKLTDDSKEECMVMLGELSKHWNSDVNKARVLSKEDLALLEKILIDEMNEALYDGKKGFSEVKNELDSAENHMNWVSRDTLESDTIGNISRTETPISALSSEQEEQWLKILSKNELEHPEWFKRLPDWEKKYFKDKVRSWKEKVERWENGAQRWKQDHPEDKLSVPQSLNLGEYLGSVPTTIRGYPGSPNAYHTQVTLKNVKGESFEFYKVRSGVLAPTKMKAKTKEAKQDKIRITKENLEQLVAAALEIRAKTLNARDNVQSGELPILLQTLYSPPFQPPGDYNNEALMKAYSQLKKELSTPEGISSFLTKHQLPENLLGSCKKITLMYASRPVNSARGLSSFLMAGTNQGRRADAAIKNFTRIIKNEKMVRQKLPQNIQIAEEALKQIKKTRSFWNTVASPFKKILGNNAMTEIAALEQIVADQLGLRIGSCVSGKDREEMVTEVAIAHMQYFAKYDKFPPPSHKKGPERDEFITMVAHQYLSGHGQVLAGENAKGCDGLKNIVDVFGQDICNKIRDLSPNYGIDPKTFDPVKDVQKTAGLNKLSKKFLKNIVKLFKGRTLEQNIEVSAPSSSSHGIAAPNWFSEKAGPLKIARDLDPENSAPTTRELIMLLQEKQVNSSENSFEVLVNLEKKARSIVRSLPERKLYLEAFEKTLQKLVETLKLPEDTKIRYNQVKDELKREIDNQLSSEENKESLLDFYREKKGELSKSSNPEVQPEKRVRFADDEPTVTTKPKH